jgi:hypothetical protein
MRISYLSMPAVTINLLDLAPEERAGTPELFTFRKETLIPCVQRRGLKSAILVP